MFDNGTGHTRKENSIKSFEGKACGTQEISDVYHNDSTGSDEVYRYAATEANTMIDFLCEVDLNKD